MLLAVSALFYWMQPRAINGWYGYRTPRSMKSQAAWELAQKLGSRGLLLAAGMNLPVHFLSWWWLPLNVSVLVPLATFLAGVGATIIVTERTLARTFPD
jgi:uncharacterized membrane protein